MPKNPRRQQPFVSHACSNCRKAHTKCDEVKPCGRCVRLGIQATCALPIRKKRGRKKPDDEDDSPTNTTPTQMNSSPRDVAPKRFIIEQFTPPQQSQPQSHQQQQQQQQQYKPVQLTQQQPPQQQHQQQRFTFMENSYPDKRQQRQQIQTPPSAVQHQSFDQRSFSDQNQVRREHVTTTQQHTSNNTHQTHHHQQQQHQQYQQHHTQSLLRLDYDDIIQSLDRSDRRQSISRSNSLNSPLKPPIVDYPQSPHSASIPYPVQTYPTRAPLIVQLQQLQQSGQQTPSNNTNVVSIDQHRSVQQPIQHQYTSNPPPHYDSSKEDLVQKLLKENEDVKVRVQMLQAMNESLRSQVGFFKQQQEQQTGISQIINFVKNVFNFNNHVAIAITGVSGHNIAINSAFRRLIAHVPESYTDSSGSSDSWIVDLSDRPVFKYWRYIFDAETLQQSRKAYIEAVQCKRTQFRIDGPVLLKGMRPPISNPYVPTLNDLDPDLGPAVLASRSNAEGIVEAKQLESHIIYDDAVQRVLLLISFIHI